MAVTIKEWYKRVNEVWPTGTLPPLTERAARLAAKRLWKWATGERLTLPIVITSGRRYTWVRRGTLYLNPSRGWDHLVHDLSHLLWRRENMNVRPHERGHAQFELRMRKQVLRRGWLATPPLEPEKIESAPTRLELRRAFHARCLASIARWEKKLARAETALVKLHRRERALRRHLIAEGDK